MGFDRKEVSKLLAQCHRRCCICHRFCGVKIETDHIIPFSDGGSDEIDNAIPVCFDCHAEIHSYNDNHPRGRKFTSEELRAHKDQWIDICTRKPESLVAAHVTTEVGPIQALVDELEFNAVVAQQQNDSQPGCLFMDDHFRRAVSVGAVSIMKDDLKQVLLRVYASIGKANQCFETAHRVPAGTNLWNPTFAYEVASKTLSLINDAREKLLEHLTA
jgi:hypothetical protein